MPVSIRDVAARANVSVSTVSKVMNDAPSRIPADTQENIRRAGLALGYAPNRMARSLGRRCTDTIGLMISGLRNPFFVDLAEAAEAALLEKGYQVLLEAASSDRGTYTRHSKLRGWPVDGILIWSAPEESLFDYIGAQAEGLPTVYLGHLRPDDPGSDAVGCDLYEGGRLIAEHFIGRGYGVVDNRRIVSIGPFFSRTGQDSYRLMRPSQRRQQHLLHGRSRQVQPLAGP